MQTSNRLLDDLAKVANGAASTLTGLKDEIDQQVRQRVERFLVDSDLVPREEFEAVRDIAVTARREQERLEGRVAELEGRLAALEAEGDASPATKAPAAGNKPAAKKSAAKSKKTSGGGAD